MKKVLRYINNNIIEFRAIRDSILLVAMLYVAWLAFKFLILNIA